MYSTPLIYAVRGGYARVVQLLVDHKVHIMHRTRHGRTAVDWGRVENQLDIVNELQRRQDIIDEQSKLFIAINWYEENTGEHTVVTTDMRMPLQWQLQSGAEASQGRLATTA